MYQISHSSKNKDYSFNAFKDKLIQICSEHKSHNRAIAFAFIFYNFENPNIRKVLNDTDYWLALDQLSGNYLTVFSINYNNKKHRNRKRINHTETYSFLTNINTFNNPMQDTDLILEKYFNIEDTFSYPSIIFFQVHNDEIIDYLIINLLEDEIEKSFLEIKEYVSSVVETIKTKNNLLSNPHILFDEIEVKLKNIHTVNNLIRFTKKYGSIFKFISTIGKLFMHGA